MCSFIPQMSPFNWTVMFLTFLLVNVLFVSKLFSHKNFILLLIDNAKTNSKTLLTESYFKWLW